MNNILRAKFVRRAEKHRAEEKRSGQTPSHGNESITGVPKLDRATDAVLRRMLATPPQPKKGVRIPPQIATAKIG